MILLLEMRSENWFYYTWDYFEHFLRYYALNVFVQRFRRKNGMVLIKFLFSNGILLCVKHTYALHCEVNICFWHFRWF